MRCEPEASPVVRAARARNAAAVGEIRTQNSAQRICSHQGSWVLGSRDAGSTILRQVSRRDAAGELMTRKKQMASYTKRIKDRQTRKKMIKAKTMMSFVDGMPRSF